MFLVFSENLYTCFINHLSSIYQKWFLKQIFLGAPQFTAFTVPKSHYEAAIACQTYNLALFKDSDDEKHQKMEDYLYEMELQGHDFWFDGRAYVYDHAEASDGSLMRSSQFGMGEPNGNGPCLVQQWCVTIYFE